MPTHTGSRKPGALEVALCRLKVGGQWRSMHARTVRGQSGLGQGWVEQASCMGVCMYAQRHACEQAIVEAWIHGADMSACRSVSSPTGLQPSQHPHRRLKCRHRHRQHRQQPHPVPQHQISPRLHRPLHRLHRPYVYVHIYICTCVYTNAAVQEQTSRGRLWFQFDVSANQFDSSQIRALEQKATEEAQVSLRVRGCRCA